MGNKEYKVSDGMFVAFAYTVTDATTGEELFKATAKAPDVMVYGVTEGIIPGLAAAIKDLKTGDKFGMTLPPEAAFGKRDEEHVMQLEKEIFMRDGEMADEIQKGAIVPMITSEGYRVQGRVMKIGDTHVTMDFNHPFADMTVKFDGEIVMVRPATEDEQHPKGGCCGGCGGGSCSDGDCGGGCGNKGCNC